MKAIYIDTEDKRIINVEYIFKDPVTSEYCSLYGESVRWFCMDYAIEKIEDYLEKEHSLYLCEEVQEDRAAHLIFEDENGNKYNVEVECFENEYPLSEEERAEIEAYEQEQEEDYWEDYMTQTYWSRFW